MHEHHPGVETIPLCLPRHAANPRGVGRAGEVWRLCQDVAVQASIRAGWPPERYTKRGAGFVVYGMTARHHRELPYGENLSAASWMRDFRRGILSTREVRLTGSHGPIAEATQRWVHVGEGFKPSRADPDLVAAFTLVDDLGPSVELPEVATACLGPERAFRFEVWHTWMDPLGHVNHPAYVDWCDEATCRALAARGVDPQLLVPVAERVDWKKGALAGDSILVLSRTLGWTGQDEAVLEHRIVNALQPDQLFATATTVRRVLDAGSEPILDAMSGAGG